MRLYLQFLQDRFHDIAGRASTEAILAALMAPEFITRALVTRIFPPAVGEAQQKLLWSLMSKGRAVAVPHVEGPLYNAVVSLAKQGMLVMKQRVAGAPDEEVDFAAPVVRQVALSRFIVPNVDMTRPHFDSLAKLLEHALMRFGSLTRTIHSHSSHRFNPEHLRLSLTRSSDDENAPIWEAQWQSEFYLATAQLLPPGVTISPEVGKIFDSDGRLDFIINGSRGWGVELVRNSSTLAKHVSRFANGHGMVENGTVKDWVVLDFCLPSSTPRPEHQQLRVWRIVYDEAYASATIHRAGCDPVRVEFRGNYEQHQQLTQGLPPATPPTPSPESPMDPRKIEKRRGISPPHKKQQRK